MTWYKLSGTWYGFSSAKAAYTDAWQELTVDLPIPAGATEAVFRLYNGFAANSGKKVYWDNISVREVLAPFGPAWSGGATGGPAAAPYTTLEFPQPIRPDQSPAHTVPAMAKLNLAGGGWITFGVNGDGASYTAEPGAESLALTKVDSSTYRITDADGAISDFTLQGLSWNLTSSRTTEAVSTTQYRYDTSTARALLTKVINPVEPGVDDTHACTDTSLPEGCEVLEYVYATTTTAVADPATFGDVTGRVKQVKLWASDPSSGTVSDTVVTEYRYDAAGQLRQVWDPRLSGPNLAQGKTATGSSACDSGEEPAKAVTGSLADKWCSDDDPLYLQVDLGSSTTVGSVVLFHAAAGDETSDYNTRDFTIQTSPDASTWTTVATITANTDAVSRHQFTPHTARHVKINISDPAQNSDDSARIYELEVYAGAPPLKTSYDYTGGRVSGVTPQGELPWQFVYGKPDVDTATMRLDLNDNSTSDTSGNGVSTTVSGSLGWNEGNAGAGSVDSGLALAGTADVSISAPTATLATDQSFTVAAWANTLDNTNTWRDVVSKDGATAFGFQLGYDASAAKWGFGMATTDTTNPTAVRAQSTTTPLRGQWTHLTGVYDHSAGQIRLYVNGVLHATTAHTSRPIAAVAAVIPGPIGAAAAGVSAVAYAYTGQWAQAAIMTGVAVLAMAGVGGIGMAARAGAMTGRAATQASKVATRTKALANYVGATKSRVKAFFANGNNVLRIGRPSPNLPNRVSIGPAPRHYNDLSRVRKIFNPIHIHIERHKVGIDFNWIKKSRYWDW